MYAWLAPITKVEKDGDAVYIYGKATDGSVDNDEQIVDPTFAKRALADWFSTGANVRQMHSTNLPPAGKGVTLESLPDGEYVKSKIVEPTAMKLTAEGVYQGYSVGISRPRIVRDSRAHGGRIVDGKIVELSVVDRPANSMAKFTLAKAAKDGSLRFVGKSVLVPAEYGPTPEPISRYRKGAHVTVFATDIAGEEQAYEGIVTRTGVNAVELDQDGYSDVGGTVRLSSLDITAAYKGAVPVLTKRDVDPDVGGGVDRDKIPSKDHVDPKGRRFPIHSPGDVSDAVSSFGRAKPAIPYDKFRRRLTSIARRKGPEFEAALPDKWKDADKGISTEDSVANATLDKEAFPGAAPPFGSEQKADGADCPTCNGSGKIREGNMTCPDCKGSGKASASAEKAADGACAKCKGAGMFDGAKCDKCKGTGKAFVVDADQPPSADKGADMSSILDDADSIKEDLKDLEDDLEDVSGQKADGDGKDDDKDGDGDSDGDGDGDSDGDGDGDGKGASPAFPKGVRVEQRNGGWVVVKGTEVVGGPHASRDAAEAQRTAIKRERKAEKAAAAKIKKAAKASAKKVAREQDTEVPWLIKRAHDFTCAAYKTEDVTEFYPSIEKNGVAAALGPTAQSALYNMLVKEVSADGGTGSETDDIYHLSKALHALKEFIAAEQAEGGQALALTLAARADLHEAFKAENPILGATGDAAVAGIPKPTDADITPGQYKRPYITAGHQREDASASPAHIPTVTHPISASDYTRGPLTDGHQRYLTGKLAEIHDGIADWRPELCLMRTMTAEGDFGAGRQPVNPLVASLGNGSTNSASSITLTGNGGTFTFGNAPITGGPVAKSITPEDIAAAVTSAVAPFQQQIDHLQKAYDALAAQPDPGRAPIRGIAGATTTKVEKVSAANEAQQEAARGRKQARVDYLMAVARGGNADQRIAAQERLAKMGIEV